MCMFKENEKAYHCEECPEAFACNDSKKETTLMQEESNENEISS